MRHGAIFIGQSPAMRPAQERYDQMFELVQLVDRLGFEHVWFVEHHFSNYAYSVNPFLMTVHAAGLTRRVRFVQGVTILPWWHPLRLAEDIAVTDLLTHGRLEIGLGRGYAPYEFRAFDRDAGDRKEMFAEGLEILERIWRDGSVCLPEGRFWPIREPVTVVPAPLQRPHPRVWMAAGAAELPLVVEHDLLPVVSTWSKPLPAADSLAALGELRRAYDALLAAHGKPFRELAALEGIFVADTDQEAQAQMEHAYWLIRVDARQRQATHRLDAGRHLEFGPLDVEPDPREWRQRLLFGSPQTVTARLRALAEQGVTYVVGAFDLGAMPHEAVRRSIERYAAEVMPAVEPVPARPA
jgi:alkanesulfonate monooxygenase SsuD/methylene tetrahydromethanopterin reductase-like flavin-dependent oxidoreductase (luciferase family)